MLSSFSWKNAHLKNLSNDLQKAKNDWDEVKNQIDSLRYKQKSLMYSYQGFKRCLNLSILHTEGVKPFETRLKHKDIGECVFIDVECGGEVQIRKIKGKKILKTPYYIDSATELDIVTSS